MPGPTDIIANPATPAPADPASARRDPRPALPRVNPRQADYDAGYAAAVAAMVDDRPAAAPSPGIVPVSNPARVALPSHGGDNSFVKGLGALAALVIGLVIVMLTWLTLFGDKQQTSILGGGEPAAIVKRQPGEVFQDQRGPKFCTDRGYTSYLGSRLNPVGGGLQHDCRDPSNGGAQSVPGAQREAAVPHGVFQDPSGAKFCTDRGYRSYHGSRRGNAGNVQHDCRGR